MANRVKDCAQVRRIRIHEAAKRLNVTRGTIGNAIRDGRLEGIRGGVAGRYYWVSLASVERIEKALKEARI